MSPMSHQISPAVVSHGRDALPRVRSVCPVPVAQDSPAPQASGCLSEANPQGRNGPSATLPYALHFQFAIGHPTLPRIAQKKTNYRTFISFKFSRAIQGR